MAHWRAAGHGRAGVYTRQLAPPVGADDFSSSLACEITPREANSCRRMVWGGLDQKGERGASSGKRSTPSAQPTRLLSIFAAKGQSRVPSIPCVPLTNSK